MAENPPDDLETMLAHSSESQPETDLDLTSLSGEDPSNSLTDESREHNLKSEALQAEEEGVSSGTGSKSMPQKTEEKMTPLQQLLASEDDVRQLGWRSYASGARDESVIQKNLVTARQDMLDNLTWKANLRLQNLEHVVPGPYIDSWTKEANLFFRRLVIINRRLEFYKRKKKGPK